jgi:hypothetical protein
MSRKSQTPTWVVTFILSSIVIFSLVLSYNLNEVSRSEIEISLQDLSANTQEIELLSQAYTGRHQGTITILNPSMRFVSSELVISNEGSFLVKTSNLGLNFLNDENLKVGGEYPSVSLQMEGNLEKIPETENQLKAVITNLKPAFYIQDAIITEEESAKVMESLKALNIDISIEDKDIQTTTLTTEINGRSFKFINNPEDLQLEFDGRKV